MGLGSKRFSHRNQPDAHGIGGPLENVLAAAPGNRAQVALARRQNFKTIVVAANSDDLLNALIVRCYFLIGDGPVFLDALHGPFFEIPRRITQRDRIPMHGSSADDTHPVHADLIGIGVADGLDNVSLIERRLLFGPQTAVRQLVGPFVRGKLCVRHLAPGFEDDNFGAPLAKFFSHHAAGGTRPDNANVIHFGSFLQV